MLFRSLVLNIDDRSSGYSRTDTIGPDFVGSAEFRTLASSYADIAAAVRSLRKGPIEVQSTGSSPVEDDTAINEETGEELTADEKDALDALGVSPAAPAPATPAAGKANPQLKSIDEFIDHFIALGRKGVAKIGRAHV